MLEQNYAVATVQLTTPGDGWADGKREVPESLRWRHAEALCGFVRLLCLGVRNRAYSGVRFTKGEADGMVSRRPRRVLPWLVRLSNLF